MMSPVTAFAQEDVLHDNSLNGTDSEVVRADNFKDYCNHIRPDDDNFVTVDKKTGKTDRLTFKKIFGKKFDKNKVRKQIKNNKYYDICSEDKDSYLVSAVFGTNLIEVKKSLKTLEGASEGVSYKGTTVLKYDNDEDTRSAYIKLLEKYGSDCVFPDIPVRAAFQGWGSETMNFDDEINRVGDAIDSGSISSNSVNVAVIDSGLDYSHEIFNNVTISSKSRTYLGRNYNWYTDNCGHGTAVAGIIAESSPVYNSGSGVKSNVNLMSYQVLNEKGEGSNLSVRNAITQAVNDGADIINLSLGSYFADYNEEQLAVNPSFDLDAYYANMDAPLARAASLDVVVCAASGNDNLDFNERIMHPGVSDYTVAVGSITKMKKRSYFSNYGKNLDFVAPGSSISLAEAGTELGYVTESGTSFACPYVTAAAVCVKTKDRNADLYDVKNELKSISEDLGTEGFDNYYGNGLPVFSEYSGPESPSGDEVFDLSDADITLSYNSTTYNGSAKKPTVSISGLDESKYSYDVTYKNNINAGTAKVIVSGTTEGNTTGSQTLTFTINPKQLTQDMFYVNNIDNIYYTGYYLEPDVIDISGSLVLNSDYSVSYSDNLDPGTGRITVTGKNNYTGVLTYTFVIQQTGSPDPDPGEQKIDISTLSISLSGTYFSYTGDYIKPSVYISGLINNFDYTVTYENNISVGTGRVIIEGIGDYTGRVVREFTIFKSYISDMMVTLSDYSYTYDGYAKVPTVTVVTKDGKYLVENVDYRLTYSNNIEAGTASVRIWGIGNFTDYTTEYFTINRDSIADKTAKLGADMYIYDGTYKKPSVSIPGLVSGRDYSVTYSNNLDVGQGTAVVTGIGNYQGSLSLKFTIYPKSINLYTPTVSASSMIYDGSAKKTTVSISGLVLNRDYTVSYSNNIQPGTAYITIKGIGNYTGVITKTFLIKKDQSQIGPVSITPVIKVSTPTMVYDGTVKTPIMTVSDGYKVISSHDYDVSYSGSRINAGVYHITVTMKNNYKGTAKTVFEIVPQSVKPSIYLSDYNYTYNGLIRTPGVTVYVNGRIIEKNNYVVSYIGGRINTGTYTVSVSLIGNYSGTASKSFTISPKTVSPKVSLSQTKYIYNGQSRHPDVSVYYDGYTLPSSDYSVTYTPDKNIGKNNVVVTMKGNYSGRVIKSFTIVPAKPKVKVKRSGSKIKLKFTKNCQISFKGKKYRVFGKSKTLYGRGKVKVRRFVKSDGKYYYSSWVKI